MSMCISVCMQFDDASFSEQSVVQVGVVVGVVMLHV